MIKNFNRFNFCNFCIATFVTLVTIYTFVTSVVFAGIANTKHDLSSTSTGGGIIATAASGVTQKCVFCHTPHSSSKVGPLWNHSLSSATYSVRFEASGYYGDPWRVTLAKQPDGSSRLCLGCHDGTVALGLLVNVPGSGMGGTVDMTQTYMPCGPTDYTCLGTNFVSSGKHLDGFGTGDHLISMEYNSALYTDVLAKCYPPESSVTYPIRDPSTISSTDPVKLYKTTHLYPPGEGNALGVQCRSCHDPHDDANGKFLVKGSPTDWDPLCNTCHMTCP
ncbi:MAG: cytochrome c3 family protein [Nitrospirae bacterium]|nr:cytochrome c3 family protein [Nitrospirota bacterium]